MAGITQSACSFRLRAGRRQWRSVRLRAERTLLIALITLAAACVPRHPVDDLTLSTQVKIELLSDPELGALRLQVSTLDGIVTLSGTVPSAADVDRAKAAARRVRGVRGVASELTVASGVQFPAVRFQLD